MQTLGPHPDPPHSICTTTTPGSRASYTLMCDPEDADQEHCPLQRTTVQLGLGVQEGGRLMQGAVGRVRAGRVLYLLEGAADALIAVQVVTGHLCKAKTRSGRTGTRPSSIFSG